MTTLNKIAENVAFTMGEQFNMTLRESIKDAIVNYRATLIRQDLDNNPLSYTDYLQSFCIELELVNKSEYPQIQVNCELLRSKQKIAKPLRIKNNGRSNFKFVGSVVRNVSLTFATPHEMQYMEHLAFQDNVYYYTVINGYMYVLNNLKFCKLLIEEIVADPRDIENCDNPAIFADDVEFPIPEDMLSTIKRLIRQDYPQYNIKDGEVVNIEPNKEQPRHDRR